MLKSIIITLLFLYSCSNIFASNLIYKNYELNLDDDNDGIINENDPDYNFIDINIPWNKKIKKNNYFNDLKKEEENYIYFLNSYNIINGYSNGNFKPHALINRAEALKILYNAKLSFGKEISKNKNNIKNIFSDISGDEWFIKYLYYSLDQKYIKGYKDGTFKPNIGINKIETIKLIFEYFEENIDMSGDIWYNGYLKKALHYKILNIKEKGYLELDKKLTRGEFSKILYKYIILTQRI